MYITKSEINSILFYQGSVGQIELEKSKELLKDFYRIGNAYEGINVLLFEGFENEKVRILQERRIPNAVLLEFVPELLKICCDIYRAMCKYTFFYETRKSLYTYRSDRIQTLYYLEQGQIPSFFSTTSVPVANSYFQKKKGILLLEIEADADILHLDLNGVLKEKSSFSHEKEILFPPFLSVYKERMELNEVEKTYADIDGKPPKAKYKLQITGMDFLSQFEDEEGSNPKEEKMQLLLKQIMQEEDIRIAKSIGGHAVWESIRGI